MRRTSTETELFLLEPNIEISSAERGMIPRLLGAAALANASPVQSNFSVKASAMNSDGEVAMAGNREYALSRAYVHGEEAVLSKMLSENPDSKITGMGFHIQGTARDQLFLSPCGNCRDVLLQETDENLLMVAGNARAAMAARLGSFLFDYNALRPSYLAKSWHSEAAVAAAKKAIHRSVDMYLPDQMQNQVYGVALVDENNYIYPGSLDTTAGYDAISPGVAAIQAFRNGSSETTSDLTKLKYIIVAGEGPAASLPQVLYRDRNALLELDETLNPEDDSKPTPVHIVNLNRNGTLRKAITTNTRQWLPHPFTNKSLGLDGISQAKLSKLRDYL